MLDQLCRLWVLVLPMSSHVLTRADAAAESAEVGHVPIGTELVYDKWVKKYQFLSGTLSGLSGAVRAIWGSVGSIWDTVDNL